MLMIYPFCVLDSGGFESPFLTIAYALEHIRAQRVPEGSDRGTIVLLQGTTYVAETLSVSFYLLGRGPICSSPRVNLHALSVFSRDF
jgi:hypothetical protein